MKRESHVAVSRGVVLSNIMLIWVAVKELNLSYYIGGTILINIYIYPL